MDTVKALQRAITPREVQEAYLSAIPSAVSAAGHGIYMLDPASLKPLDVTATVPDTFLQRYEDEGRFDDPVLKNAVETKEPIDSSRLPERYSWDTSRVLAILQQAGFYHSLEAPVLVEGEILATLNMTRQREQEPFSEQDLAVMKAIADQVGAALTRAQRQEQISKEALLLADALDADAQPIIITTMDGQLIFRNRMASKPVPGSSASYFERVQPALLKALGELRVGTKRVATALEQASFTSGKSDTDNAARASSGLVLVKAVRLKSRNDAVVAFLSHRSGNLTGLPESPIPLSPRERGITDLVSQGLTTRQIAELSYVSENTVKQHLKRIFSKLGVNSRAELVQAVWKASTTPFGVEKQSNTEE